MLSAKWRLFRLRLNELMTSESDPTPSFINNFSKHAPLIPCLSKIKAPLILSFINNLINSQPLITSESTPQPLLYK